MSFLLFRSRVGPLELEYLQVAIITRNLTFSGLMLGFLNGIFGVLSEGFVGCVVSTGSVGIAGM